MQEIFGVLKTPELVMSSNSIKFYKQLGIGSGFGFRFNIAYVTLRLDLAYKIYDPNMPEGDRWNFKRIKPLQPTFNFAFGYPF